VKIIGISSGKGGVGKSTVAVNLSCALAARGLGVGLIDADFYGPSVPILLGEASLELNNQNKIIPAFKYSVKYVSIQFFLPNPDEPVIWRGPMITKALEQLLRDVDWTGVDYLLIDMPPGTGDIQISLSQQSQISGVILVTTPQKVAFSDVRKARRMFEKVRIPFLGYVANMVNSERFSIFGNLDYELINKEEILIEIPLNPEIAKMSDEGKPPVLFNVAPQFFELADRVIEKLENLQHS
jgi:ATP-binding protein involved in chromosome partitioning